MTIPLVILALFSLTGGFIELPENIGPVQLFSKLLTPILPSINTGSDITPEWLFQFISAIISIGGIYLAFILFYKRSAISDLFDKNRISDFFYKGWGFDRFYDLVFVRPVVWISEVNKKDFIDKFYSFIASGTSFFNLILSKTQNGKLRWYITVLTAGIVVLLTIMLTL
jgi:NADH-quinone oxidoreductase subunit L